MITPTSFRQDYQEFANAAIYPNSTIAYWTVVAGLLLNTNRWGNGSVTASAPPCHDLRCRDRAVAPAHNIVLEKQAAGRQQAWRHLLASRSGPDRQHERWRCEREL